MYVDSVRFLPASSTLPAMEITLMNTHFEKVKFKDLVKMDKWKKSEVDVQLCDQSMDAYSPSALNVRMEFRSKKFENTLGICIRVDTIDEITQELRVVGYGYLNVFCQQGKTEAPEGASDRAFVLNEGGHQVPIYYGKVNPNKGSWDATHLKQFPKIPCTSVLVRGIVHALVTEIRTKY